MDKCPFGYNASRKIEICVRREIQISIFLLNLFDDAIIQVCKSTLLTIFRLEYSNHRASSVTKKCVVKMLYIRLWP